MAFLPFTRTFTKILVYFPWNSNFGMLTIENFGKMLKLIFFNLTISSLERSFTLLVEFKRKQYPTWIFSNKILHSLVWEFIFSLFLTPWKLLENKYLEIFRKQNIENSKGMLKYWKLEKLSVYPKNGKKTQNFDSKS